MAALDEMTDQQQLIRYAAGQRAARDCGALRSDCRPRARQCLADPKALDRLLDITRAANGLGINRTPTFSINGKVRDACDLGGAGARAQGGAGRLSMIAGGGIGLRIRRLKLSGFKSFVEPAELRIEPGLTGVVGPNGCGKSNLLEAIRWVMGESEPQVAARRRHGRRDLRRHRDPPARAISPKSRSCSSATLPRTAAAAAKARSPAGSSAAPAPPIASTAATFAPRTSRLLFADAATGAHSPALVSQGKIGAVIAAKPAERRQLLEEAAGISGLARPAQGRRAEAARDRSQSDAARRNPRRPGAARRAAPAAGAGGRALSQAHRPDPAGRGAAAACPLERGGGGLPRPRTAEAQAAAEDEVAARSSRRWPTPRPRRSEAAQALTERRAALAELRESGHALAHELGDGARAARHGRAAACRARPARRVAEGATCDREQALQAAMPKRRIAQLDEERAAIAAAARRCRERMRRESQPS